jgi:hypothetical protein
LAQFGRASWYRRSRAKDQTALGCAFAIWLMPGLGLGTCESGRCSGLRGG